MQTIRKRADFLAAARGRKWNGSHFTMQVLRRSPPDTAPPRFGFTVTKRVGIATDRNRIRRRLREAVRRSAPSGAEPGHDYVLIARRSALKAPFDRLVADLEDAFSHTGGKR